MAGKSKSSSSKSKKPTKSKSPAKKQTQKKTKITWYSALIIIIILIVSILVEGEDLEKNPESILEVHYIDVGQGDCIFIECEDENMLIDCGESSESDKVIAYLQEQGVNKIDYLVGTHPHSDHMGGMSSIIDNFEISNFYMPYLDDSDIPTTKYFERLLNSLDAKGIEIKNSKVGDTIEVGSADALVIAPNSQDYDNANDYSIGIILSHGQNSFIFTGDAETPAEAEMIENGLLRDIDVYKAGHHGSVTSSSEDFLEVIKPDYVVIMCGENNSYGHPHDEILERFEKYTDNIYRTDKNGSIIAESDGDNIKFTTERQ